MEQRYARITGLTSHYELPIGTIVPIELYHRGWAIGAGADGALLEITVSTPSGDQVKVPARSFEYASAAQAKAWRTARKKLRSRGRRGLEAD
jgi:hypothetical protein